MKRLAIIVIIAAIPVTARAEQGQEKTVALTQAELVILLKSEIAAARAQDARAAARPVEDKLRSAFMSSEASQSSGKSEQSSPEVPNKE